MTSLDALPGRIRTTDEMLGPQRTFAEAVRALAAIKDRHTLLDLETRGRELTDAEERLWAELDDRRVELENEACAAFVAETGVAWPFARAALS